jgi:oligopeptide transport system permease protein
MIMGTVIVYSAILLAMNFIVDILYGVMDPRISYR